MEDKIRVLLTEEEVNEKIKKIGEQVSKDYAGKSVHMICVLKGGVFFTCELAKRISRFYVREQLRFGDKIKWYRKDHQRPG